MDSLTQATLGAAVAHAGWHRPLGRWSLPWGVALGTLPDLDVLAGPWLDAVEKLYWHRGPSHGVLGVLLLTLVAAAVVGRVHRASGLTSLRATVVAALILATHVAIDCFTVYGTQLLAPFSRHGFGTNNLFIIDPLYTLPLLAGVLLAAVCARSPAGRRANIAGLVVSTLYVAWSFAAQARAAANFERELARQGVVAVRGLTSAAPLNTVLWRHLAEVEGGFLVGYWSLLDSDGTVEFTFVPRRAELATGVRGTRAFEVIDWFSQGWWIAADSDGVVRLSDLRFGELRPAPLAPPEDWAFVFSWRVGPGVDDPSGLEQTPLETGRRTGAFGMVWRRMLGDRTAW